MAFDSWQSAGSLISVIHSGQTSGSGPFMTFWPFMDPLFMVWEQNNRTGAHLWSQSLKFLLNHNDRPSSYWDVVHLRFGGYKEDNIAQGNAICRSPLYGQAYINISLYFRNKLDIDVHWGSHDTCSEDTAVPRRVVTNRSGVNKHWTVIYYSLRNTACACYNNWLIQELKLLIRISNSVKRLNSEHDICKLNLC